MGPNSNRDNSFRYIGLSFIIFVIAISSFAYVKTIDTPFTVADLVLMGDEAKSVKLEFLNDTTVIELTFTDTGTDKRPIIDLRGHEPYDALLRWNQTGGAGTGAWIVLTEAEPIVSGLVANEVYFPANDTLKLRRSADGVGVLSWVGVSNPALPQGTTLPLLLVPILMAFFGRKIPVVLIMASVIFVVIIIAIYG